jgi:hypothetical protein
MVPACGPGVVALLIAAVISSTILAIPRVVVVATEPGNSAHASPALVIEIELGFLS